MFLLKREDVLGQTNVCLHAYGRSFLYMEGYSVNVSKIYNGI